ncbi:unnamed protein product [Bursaphelenchus okinawaensis]|uniref:COMM domain-containing protein n=1 Tax=Bursaphelenchus okinawaensis TaxID=465554 RepID=A0A811L1E3_9BILA|nr:unnamed protein product [Bursaphelenchus okinawaensis]CAG9116939.1 unnamed protein product [Bursaphelenchus okinawaensis]
MTETINVNIFKDIDEFIKVSSVILNRTDWDCSPADQKGYQQSLGAQTNDEWFEELFLFWKRNVRNQTKPKELQQQLLDFNVPVENVERIVELWKTEAPATIKKAKLVSASGKPQVSDIRWGLELERATRFNTQKREPLINFAFKTDQGSKNVKMDIDQLTQLHLTLKDIQSHIDSVFK